MKTGWLGKSTTKVIHHIVEHIYDFTATWRIVAYVGAFTPSDGDGDNSNVITLKERTGTSQLRVKANEVPLKTEGQAFDVSCQHTHPIIVVLT